MAGKDYQVIASVLREWRPIPLSNASSSSQQGVRADLCMLHECIVDGLADALYDDNSRFDAEKFVVACGYPAVERE